MAFVIITAEDWKSAGVMDGKEWQSVEKKVKAICSSRTWLMGTGAGADNEKGVSRVNPNPTGLGKRGDVDVGWTGDEAMRDSASLLHGHGSE